MIGIVIVSHSAKLAEGVVELARGMGGPEARLKAAGGMSPPGDQLGTDPMLVLSAIEEVYSEDGVVVLVDLGSAILSTEMALDMLPPEKRDRVVLCEAPLVEGAISAAVQARLGSPLEQVVNEARGALAAKAAHFSESLPAAESDQPPSRPDQDDQSLELRLVVNNPLGLHARPAARFVQTVGRYPQATLQVTNLTTGRGPISGKSINALATLGIRQGHEILISALGPESQAVLDALHSLAEDNFGDKESTAAATLPPTTQRNNEEPSTALQGLSVSPGIAIGPTCFFRRVLPAIPEHTAADVQAEWKALLVAVEKTRTQIQAQRETAARRTDAHTATIFEAHLLFLDDEALLMPARAAVFNDRQNAAAAWQHAVEQIAADYRGLDDRYLQARAADVEDVGTQVLVNLLGSETLPEFNASGILIAVDLTPADITRLDPARVLGICTAQGGPTSHSAILARSLGIPAVAGLGDPILSLAEGVPLLIDGEAGTVWPHPMPSQMADYSRRAEAEKAARAEAQAASAAPAVTRDGHQIEIAANIGSAAEARAAVAAGAEGVGIFRTEFLFLDRQTAPDEEEQYRAYRAVAEALAGRPLIVRTLDAGGDKPIPYLHVEPDANPFLGWRAIRLCLDRPDFFKVQLRAIVRLAADFPIKVIFPMIATLSEWQLAAALLAEARREVIANGLPVPDRIETGIMVEIPSAALCAAQFAGEVDFFSIGTNDLTQYTLAAERGNPHVAALLDAFHPAVLALIQHVANAGHAQGKWVGVCGEMGGDPLAIPLLVGLGIDELSMSAAAIPRAKQIVRSLDYVALQSPAASLVNLATPEAVRAALPSLMRTT